jgi:hypothetical protein
MDKLHWTTPQICEIEVKMTGTGSINKVGNSSDAYTAQSLVTGSFVTVHNPSGN